jgi:hypothetical protein
MGSALFLARTLPRVKTETSLHVLAYNMKRVMKILGIKDLIDAVTHLRDFYQQLSVISMS